jgi:hypothetical protein
MTDIPNKIKLVLSVDIETSGCNVVEHGILAIGYCVGDLDGNVLFKDRINMMLDDGCYFEERCVKEFWSKYPDVLKTIQTDAVGPHVGIRAFVDFVYDLEEQYDLIIISDNPVFDIGFLNYYMAKYLKVRPLSYTSTGSYRPIFDTDCYTRGVLRSNYDDLWTYDSNVIKALGIELQPNILHNHLPENDAEYVYFLHIAVVTAIATHHSKTS